MRYMTKGVCAQAIDVELEGNVIKKVQFLGGCHGNTQGVARLVEGMTVEEAVRKMRGIRCGMKPTSCPDQLANALEQALAQ